MKRQLKKLLCISAAVVMLLVLGAMSVSAASTGTPGSDDGNFFTALYGEVCKHSTEILSALTLLGSVVLTFSYKKGLMPSIRQSVGGLGNMVKEIKTSVDSSVKISDDTKSVITESLDILKDTVKKLEKSITDTTARLDALGDLATDRERLEIIMDEQIELLYNVFMYSSMPEYQKDAIGRRVEAIRKLLSDGGQTKNDEAVV